MVATALPAGAAVPVPREYLLVLLGEVSMAEQAKETPLLTVDEVAQRLNVDKQTVRRRQKPLGAVKIGRSVRFTEAGITKYLDRSRRGS
jgi:excisionase family DNA binding protein